MPQKGSPPNSMTAAMLSERDKLAPDLRPHFDNLVEAYRYNALLNHGAPYVSYKVLASLIRDGWRQSADPTEA